MRSATPRRSLGAVQAAAGAVLLAAPAAVSAAVAGPGRQVPAWLVRVLGARMLGQGCLLTALPADGVLLACTVAELLHGASMVAAAALAPQYRRSALVSASVAGLAALVQGAAVR